MLYNGSHDSQAGAAVNPANLVKLYHPDGHTIYTEMEGIPDMLTRGYTTYAADPEVLLAEVRLWAEKAVLTLTAYVTDCQQAGCIDPSAESSLAVAYRAVAALNSAIDHLQSACAAKWAVKSTGEKTDG